MTPKHPAGLRAIVPAAGLGTRLRPLTDVIPKEMLVIGGAPVIEHVLREIRDSGVDTATIVLSPAKDMIRRFVSNGARFGLRVDYALQAEMLGVGDAVLRGLGGQLDETVLVAFGDCAIVGGDGSATQRLIAAHSALASDATALCEQVPRERVRHYGVLEPEPGGALGVAAPFRVTGIVEKPEPERAPSTYVVAGRWVLGPRMLSILSEAQPGSGGEVGVTESVAHLLRSGGLAAASPLQGDETRCDVGNWPSFVAAQVLASLCDPVHGSAARSVLAVRP